MIKRLCLLALIISVLFMGGCWNYKSLDKLNIVVGVAVDYDNEKEMFNMTYELANLSGQAKTSPITGRIIHTEGKTLFDAARNANLKESKNLFFGATTLLIVDQEIAKEKGILPILDWFIRDSELRETLNVVISQEDKAADILESSGEDKKEIISSNIHDAINGNKKISSTTVNTQIYQILNDLYSTRKSTLIPTIRLESEKSKSEKGKSEDGKNTQGGTGSGSQGSGSDGEGANKSKTPKAPKITGVAVIKGDKLAGFLSTDMAKYILLIEDKLNSGIITLSSEDVTGEDISLEIFKNNSKLKYSYKDENLTIRIETNTYVTIGENTASLNVMDEEVIKKVEEAASKKVEMGIKELVDIFQHEFNADVLGFGEIMHKRNHTLWKQLEPSWDQIFPNLDVEVSSKIKIINAGASK